MSSIGRSTSIVAASCAASSGTRNEKCLCPEELYTSSRIQQNCACNVRSAPVQMQSVMQSPHQQRQQHQPRQHSAAVYQDASKPLHQIISPGFKNEELVAKIRDRDCNQVRKCRRVDVGETQSRHQQRCKQRVQAVPENGVPHAHHQITRKLSRRHLLRKSRPPPESACRPVSGVALHRPSHSSRPSRNPQLRIVLNSRRHLHSACAQLPRNPSRSRR